MRDMDTNVRCIGEFENGHTIWRCTNGGGVPYSYIENEDGHETFSHERHREADMIKCYEEVEHTKVKSIWGD